MIISAGQSNSKLAPSALKKRLKYTVSNREKMNKDGWDIHTWYRLARPSKIEEGIDFHIFSSTPGSALLSGLVCPNPLPNEHSPILFLSEYDNQPFFKYSHIKCNIMKIFHQICRCQSRSLQCSVILCNQTSNAICKQDIKLIGVSHCERWRKKFLQLFMRFRPTLLN